MLGEGRYAAATLSLLRIVAGLLFMQHGLQKIVFWPPGGHNAPPFVLLSLVGLAAVLELGGGILLVLGLLSRPVAFVLAGEMAVAYWTVHFAVGMGRPYGWMPVVNEGDLAILFCFVFLLVAAAGPGPLSLDAVLHRASRRQDHDYRATPITAVPQGEYR